MNRTKNKLLAVGLAFIALLTSCQKEPTGRLELIAEGMGSGNTKMYVNELSSYWQTGDKVNINGTESTITVNNEQAYVNGEFTAENYCIVYPSSIYQSRSGNVVTVEMPATYQYHIDGNGHQVIDAPLAYYGTASGGTVLMKHLTGALNVQISGPSGLVIDRITVGTTQNRVMNGEMQFDLSAFDNFGSSTSNNSTNNTIQMLFDQASFTTGTVQIPIPVLSDDVNFTIKVEGRVADTKYTYERAQDAGGHLSRSELGYVSIDMSDNTYTAHGSFFPTETINGDVYYILSSATDLKILGEASPHLMYSGINYRLSQDIDASGAVIHAFRSIVGIFDGNGKTISNLYITSGNFSDPNYSHCLGLFLDPGNGIVIKDLTINGLTVTANYDNVNSDSYSHYVAALFPMLRNPYSGTVTNVTITSFRVLAPNNNVFKIGQLGGFVGNLQGNVTISDCSLSFANQQEIIVSSSSHSVWVGGILGNCNISSNNYGNFNCINTSIDFGTINIHATNDENSDINLYFGGCIGNHNNCSNSKVIFSGCSVRGIVNLDYDGIYDSHLRYGSIVGYTYTSPFPTYSSSQVNVEYLTINEI